MVPSEMIEEKEINFYELIWIKFNHDLLFQTNAVKIAVENLMFLEC